MDKTEKILKRFALHPEEREKECKHNHTHYRGSIPNTGPLICSMCGMLFDPRSKEPLGFQDFPL